MVEAAGHLTKLEYTKAALRMLDRVDRVPDDLADKALRSACSSKNFERLWKGGEFQRITGCRSAGGPDPDGGVSDSGPSED